MSTLNAMIFKARNTICKQLEERNFDVSMYKHFSLNDISILQEKEELDIIALQPDNKKVYVKFSLQKQRINNIQEMVEDLYENKLETDDDLIFILKEDINQTIKDYIKSLYYKEKKFVTIFHIRQLQFNILDHSFVPKHIVLSETDKANVYHKYNVKEDSMMPEISRFDPVAMSIGLRPGELCHIIRTSKTAIHSDYYRICV